MEDQSKRSKKRDSAKKSSNQSVYTQKAIRANAAIREKKGFVTVKQPGST